MNNKRIIEQSNILNAECFTINPNWLVGFFEGDGTFGIKNGSAYLQIAKKNTSQPTLNAITKYLELLPHVDKKILNY